MAGHALVRGASSVGAHQHVGDGQAHGDRGEEVPGLVDCNGVRQGVGSAK
jgi:hypothetical protein